MHGFKISRVIYVVGVFLLLCSFAFVSTNAAYEYKIGVSRSVVGVSDPKIVGIGGESYDFDYFTGLGYCTGYYYLNHHKLTAQYPIGQARQVLRYDSGVLNMFLNYLNFRTGGALQWNDGGITGPDQYSGRDIYIYNLSQINGASTNIPYVYTIGRFGLINKTNVSQATISGHYLSNPGLNGSTYIAHSNNTGFLNGADTGYNFTIKYYAQPCVPDSPITADNITKINGNASGQYTLAKIPAFDFAASASSTGGRPVTIGATLSDTTNYIPGARNIGASFLNHISFDSGIFLAIKEPSISSNPPYSASAQAYSYTTGGPRYSGFVLVDGNYGVADSGTSNQRGINPDRISVYISFTGVDKNNYADTGVFCTGTITGSGNLGLSGLGYSWNRNQLGYSINISSGTIRALAKQRCPSQFASIATGNLDLKRETVADISWDARDFSNSMLITQESNDVTYTPANQIAGTTGYSFNSYSGYPVLSMATDTTGLIDSVIKYNIPISNSNLRFTGTDVYAGINSGTFLIIVSGYESNISGLSNNRKTSGIPNHSYIFSGSGITKFAYNLHYERYDYTGLVDFFNNLSATTGMYFTVSLRAADFVGNSITQNYIFETPTWPNAPKQTTTGFIQAQTKSGVGRINFIDNIKQDTVADGVGGSNYNYTTYYPSSSGLITDFAYISGASYLTSNISLQLVSGSILLTGLTFYYNGSGSYLSGTPYVSSGGQTMTDYTATTFTFRVLATNIYGITGVLTYDINVAPSCTESAGCTDPVYIFWGTDLAAAKYQETGARTSGALLAAHRYPHWFIQIKQSGPNFYFTGVVGDPLAKVLYCATTGNSLLIAYGGYSGPQNGSLSQSPADFTGATLNISGGVINQFGQAGAFTATIIPTSGALPDGSMVIYANRPLTGRVFYSVCERTGGTTLDVFGCYVDGRVNRTKLAISDIFTITGRIEGGWLTGNWNGYVTGGSLITGNQVNFWSAGIVYAGGGYRNYVRTGNTQQNINTSGSVTFTAENRTGATTNFNYEVYWIDNTAPDLTGNITDFAANQYKTIQIVGSNTGQLANSQISNLTGDDEWIITAFSGNTGVRLYINGYGSGISTGGQYIASGIVNDYVLTRDLIFASDWTGYILYRDRAGNTGQIYIDVTGIGNKKDVSIVVRPAFRPSPYSPDNSATGYKIMSGDFWLWIDSGGQWVESYNSAIHTGTDDKVTTNKYGTGMVSILPPADGSGYLVVFKGSGMLSVGFTGIRDSAITEFNFFSGTSAATFSSDFVYQFITGGVTGYYVKVGDVSVNGTGDYDYVGTPDFSAINNNLTTGTPIHPYRYDFDINGVISSMEQSMVLQARGFRGFIGWMDSRGIPMTGFVTF